MLSNLILGVGTMALCLLLQALLLLKVVNYYFGHTAQVRSGSRMAGLWVVCIVMLLLVLGNLGQVAVWALLFQVLGEFQQFSEAYYHSAVNFATLGYGDLVMSEQHKLLGPLEAINGVLMIGVSTAALMSVLQDSMRQQRASGSS